MTECLFTVIKSYFRTLLLLFTQLGQKEGEGQVVGPSLSTVSEFMGKWISFGKHWHEYNVKIMSPP